MVRLLRRLRGEERGAQTIEFLLAMPLAVALIAAILGQLALAAVGLVTCEAAARDAALAASRGNDPVLAARKAAPDWDVSVSEPRYDRSTSYHGVQVTVSLTVPALPLRMLAGRGFVISRTATMPVERG